MTLRQQKISSLRRNDTMWIYKNPQGLLILEDELNERRKRRSARHRSSPPLPRPQPKQELREKAVLTPPVMQLASPSDVLIPIAKKADANVKPINNISTKEPLKRSAIADKPTIKNSKQPPKPTVKTNLIEERSKLFKASNNSDMSKDAPKEIPKLINAKPRSIASNRDDQFLSEVKHKLSPVKPEVEKSSSKVPENDGPVAPPRRKGLVSSFVSAFEAPSSNTPTRTYHITKPRALVDVKPIASQSYNPVSSSRLESNHDPLPPVKPRRQAVMPSPTTTVSSPALSTPSPFAVAVVPTDSYFPMTTAFLPQQKQATLSEPETKISSSVSSQKESAPCSNEINVYLPQLSPEISFHESILEDVSAGEQEEENSEDDEPLDVEVASILERPEIKKRVSFSDQLLTYIPEQQASDDDIVSNKSTETPSSKNPIKTKQTVERKVNTAPYRDKYVPAAETRKIFEPEVAPKRPLVANVLAPQKLSNKLLDMFQQKLSTKASFIEQQQLPKTQQPESRGLVHLTKSRPRKPPSLKKPTYPAATAQPNWRERATNRKYEFIA
ncbi:uncharacterized protein ATC70_003440 [Mucor velutinosus]|uniref:Uncharacterized protein n=1 Tax=Mucor velutinosus TaxID=708070 RepID=A0AAN7HLC9_9FUNG|nr:hypothetical protein ATC70_003440 [Mucor velutinosus]